MNQVEPWSNAGWWVCPTCKNRVHILYEFLVDHGMPVCDPCDEDMEFDGMLTVKELQTLRGIKHD